MRLCIFEPKGAIQIRYYYIYYYDEFLQGQNRQVLGPLYVKLPHFYAQTSSNQPKGLAKGLIFQGC